MEHDFINVKNLSVTFTSKDKIFHAVKNISFVINKGETMALVGESGSGKSVTALSMLQLLPKATTSYSDISSIKVDKEELIGAKSKFLRSIRGNKISMIFQEPMTSLNPYQKVGTQIEEILILHKKLTKKEARRSS